MIETRVGIFVKNLLPKDSSRHIVSHKVRPHIDEIVWFGDEKTYGLITMSDRNWQKKWKDHENLPPGEATIVWTSDNIGLEIIAKELTDWWISQANTSFQLSEKNHLFGNYH